jgi:hypothetical protein
MKTLLSLCLFLFPLMAAGFSCGECDEFRKYFTSVNYACEHFARLENLFGAVAKSQGEYCQAKSTNQPALLDWTLQGYKGTQRQYCTYFTANDVDLMKQTIQGLADLGATDCAGRLGQWIQKAKKDVNEGVCQQVRPVCSQK